MDNAFKLICLKFNFFSLIYVIYEQEISFSRHMLKVFFSALPNLLQTGERMCDTVEEVAAE